MRYVTNVVWLGSLVPKKVCVREKVLVFGKNPCKHSRRGFRAQENMEVFCQRSVSRGVKFFQTDDRRWVSTYSCWLQKGHQYLREVALFQHQLLGHVPDLGKAIECRQYSMVCQQFGHDCGGVSGHHARRVAKDIRWVASFWTLRTEG